jgi:hypothetical protein
MEMNREVMLEGFSKQGTAKKIVVNFQTHRRSFRAQTLTRDVEKESLLFNK